MLPNIPGNVLKHSGQYCLNIPGNVTKHSGKCPQAFREMLLNILGNVAKNPWECSETFRGMSSNISGNFARHSGKCSQTFWETLWSIPGNALKYIGECVQIFHGMLPNILEELVVWFRVCGVPWANVGSVGFFFTYGKYSFSLKGIGPTLGYGYGIWGQNYVALLQGSEMSEMTAGLHCSNIMLAI